MIRDGIKSVAVQGACHEKKWPYIISKFTRKPTKACYTDALRYQVLAYKRIITLEEMKACLADGYPVVIGFSVYESFETQEVASTGIVPSPNLATERLLGGHAVLVVGYDTTTKRIIVRNSWGTGWGQAGYFTLPFEYITNRNLSDDFWTVTVEE